MKNPSRSLIGMATGLILIGVLVSAHAATPSASDTATDNNAAGTPSPEKLTETIEIPGPLRSFLRMAGVSQEAPPSEVLPLLARNAFLYGYQLGRKTEYLILAERYVQQARELQTLAGPDGNIRVKDCDDARQLIGILGYHFEHGCSHDDATLITADAERAFLTTDSGFPLTRLEQSLQQGTPFVYAFPASRIPILFNEHDWTQLIPMKQRSGAHLLDVLMNNEEVDRLYSGMARLDPETRNILYQAPGLRKLLPYAGVVDFYGNRICIRSGVVLTPGSVNGDANGSTNAASEWQNLVGQSPASPAEFITHLLAKDQGWLAAYYDAVARISPEQQAPLMQGDRLKRLYDAFKSSAPTLDSSMGVFPRNCELLLLLSRIRWNDKAQPLVPGQLAMWQEVLTREAKVLHTSHGAGRARAAGSPDGLLEALAAYSNVTASDGPAQIYLMLSAIDGARPADRQLSDAATRLLAGQFSHLDNWYRIFAEFPALDDQAISHFIETAGKVNAIQNPSLRSNTLGALQAEIGIWQIMARQQQIPESKQNASWLAVVDPYATAGTSNQLFEAAHKSLQSVIVAAGGSADLSQDEIVNLLAGPPQKTPEGQRVRDELARRLRSVLDDQRLVSFDTLFGLYDGLGQMEHGAQIADSMVSLAGNLREFELPQPIFSQGERTSWSPLVYTNRHAELQVRTDLTKTIRASATPAELEDARSRLFPFLRDTLVGLNYAYYEPPGAQVLHSNPLFVRSHDFSASSIQGVNEVWGVPVLVGIGATAGGGAYMIGSLADLPYELALAEADFLSPEKVQALIWREMVPELQINAVLPRWWNVTGNELHAVDLYQKVGVELLNASVKNVDLRQKVIAIYADRMDQGNRDAIEQALEDQASATLYINHILPADTFYLAVAFRRLYPQQATEWGPASRELDELAHKHAADTDPARLERDFGVPHPTMADSDGRNLLVGEPFPVTGGYTSRLFGESWESSNLYWAQLADEKGYSPVALNLLVPELTARMIANISATTIDDWPALQRAMMQTGKEFMDGKLNGPDSFLTAANLQNTSTGSETR